ncbi:MAG TPA: porin family protein [Pseudomonadales bacterium]
MKSRALVAGLLAAGLTGAVQAEDQGFYAGTGAGMYYVDIDGIDFDESAATLRAFGGFKLNPYLSFEAGFTNLFEASTDIEGVGVDLDGTAWDVSVRPSYPISETFTVFGVLGWTEYDFEMSVDAGNGISASADGGDGDLHYGLGGALTINDAWHVRGEWTTVDVDDVDFGMFSLSAVYNFH